MQSGKLFFYDILFHGDIWCEQVYHRNHIPEVKRWAMISGRNLFWPRRILKSVLYERYLDFCEERGQTELHPHAFGRAAKRYAGFEGINIKLSTERGRFPAYELPPLERARERFRIASGISPAIRWPMPNPPLPGWNETLHAMQEAELTASLAP